MIDRDYNRSVPIQVAVINRLLSRSMKAVPGPIRTVKASNDVRWLTEILHVADRKLHCEKRLRSQQIGNNKLVRGHCKKPHEGKGDAPRGYLLLVVVADLCNKVSFDRTTQKVQMSVCPPRQLELFRPSWWSKSQ